MAWIERCLFEENIIGDEEKLLKQSLFARWKWVMIGLAVLILGISILEYKQPYYFVQDDNFVEVLPIILEGCHTFMKGAILDWSPYQFFGFPIGSIGEYVLTYPPTYLSYGIARYLLGNELFTLDVFCILHLIVGYFVSYLLLRRNKLDPVLAMAGSLSFILSGYTLIAGRSWFSMIACVVWMPLLFLSVIVLQQGKPTWKWIIGTGSVMGIFYHIGHAQMWAYAIMFFLFSIAILFYLGKLPLNKVLYVIPAFLFGLAIVMPLLIPQWLIVRDIQQRPPWDFAITYKGILAMLLPYPLVHAPHPEIGGGTAYDREYITPFYYSGTLFSAVFFGTILVILVLLLFKRNKLLLLKRFIADNVWIILALFAFILALGKDGLLWTLQSKLPIFNKFRMPFKFLHFVNLFAVMGGGVIIERGIRLARNKRFWRLFLSIGVCSLMLYHINLATASFYSYGDKPMHLQSYKDSHNIDDSLNLGNARRVLSLSANHSPKTGYIFSLNHNFPTFFHIFAFGGYDPFIDMSPYFTKAKENLFSHLFEAARAYGIRWVIFDKCIEEAEWIDARSLELANFFLAHGVKHLITSEYVLIRLNNARPLAFAEDNPQEAMPIYVKNNGMDIDVSRISATGGRLVINMLWRPEITTMHDKEKLKSVSDRWGRVVTEVPPHARTVKFRYVPPWRAGFIWGTICLLCAILSYFFLKIKIQ